MVGPRRGRPLDAESRRRANAPDLFGHYFSRQDELKPLIFRGKHGSVIDGSTFRAASEEGQRSGKRNCTCKLKIIVADDEEIIANTLTQILNLSGFEARAVYSGEAALQVLDCFEPDVLISDVVMTGITGVEAAIAVQALTPNCKVLLFSGQAATTDLPQGAGQRDTASRSSKTSSPH
jgi:CheY-like chemotaxis protein